MTKYQRIGGLNFLSQGKLCLLSLFFFSFFYYCTTTCAQCRPTLHMGGLCDGDLAESCAAEADGLYILIWFPCTYDPK